VTGLPAHDCDTLDDLYGLAGAEDLSIPSEIKTAC
jgi:hypothetical protein